MWNILIVLIIAIIIWFFGASSLNFNPNQQSSLKIPNQTINKPVSTKTAVESLTNPTVQEVNQSRQYQQQEQQDLNNN